MDDPGKIALVLGSAFVKKRPTPESLPSAAWELEEDEDRETFETTDPMTLEVDAFQAIYA